MFCDFGSRINVFCVGVLAALIVRGCLRCCIVLCVFLLVLRVCVKWCLWILLSSMSAVFVFSICILDV